MGSMYGGASFEVGEVSMVTGGGYHGSGAGTGVYGSGRGVTWGVVEARWLWRH